MKLTGLRITVVAGLLAGLLLSPNLWLSSRFFPLSPVWSALKPLAPPWDRVVFFTLLGLLVLAGAASRRWIHLSTFGLLALVALQDQSRWQPWFYQYLFMLLAIGLAGVESPEAALNTCRLIIVSIYVWSGLAKLNPNFMNNLFPWMIEPFTHAWPPLAQRLVQQLAYSAPFLECGIGLGLLTRRFRAPALIGAVGMHVFILVAIGPLGRNVNVVVWPWNVAMLCFLVVLFRQAGDVSTRDILWGPTPRGKTLAHHRIALLLFGLAPALGFFNLWDHYLSSELYSGNKTSGVLYFSDAVFDQLPDEIGEYVTEDSANRNRLDIANWSYGELNVPPYPEVRIYKNLGKRICDYALDPSEVELVVRTKLALINSNRESRYSCSGLR